MDPFDISSPDLYPYWGLGAFLSFTMACLPPALTYRGRAGQRYHTFNHFISELGETGVSRHAKVFNGFLVFTGVLMACFFVQFGRFFGSAAGWSVAALGLLMAVFCMMVGFVPMNRLRMHMTWACLTFMIGAGVFAATGAAIAMDETKRLPVFFAIGSFAVAALYAVFLILPGIRENRQVFEPMTGERPKLWYIPMMEWGAILGTMILVATICVYSLF